LKASSEESTRCQAPSVKVTFTSTIGHFKIGPAKKTSNKPFSTAGTNLFCSPNFSPRKAFTNSNPFPGLASNSSQISAL